MHIIPLLSRLSNNHLSYLFIKKRGHENRPTYLQEIKIYNPLQGEPIPLSIIDLLDEAALRLGIFSKNTTIMDDFLTKILYYIYTMNKTRSAYNSSANAYETKFAHYETYQKQIQAFSDLLPDESSILDIGCGPGLNAAFFTNQGHSVTGIDFSSSMVELARKNCSTGTFYEKDVENLEISAQFDALCLSFIIVHLRDEKTEALISKLPALIRPGGMVYISFMTGKKGGYETTSFSREEIYFNYYDPETIRSLFEKYGFTLQKQQSEPYPEENGTITEDIFLIFKQNRKSLVNKAEIYSNGIE